MSEPPGCSNGPLSPRAARILENGGAHFDQRHHYHIPSELQQGIHSCYTVPTVAVCSAQRMQLILGRCQLFPGAGRFFLSQLPAELHLQPFIFARAHRRVPYFVYLFVGATGQSLCKSALHVHLRKQSDAPRNTVSGAANSIVLCFFLSA